MTQTSVHTSAHWLVAAAFGLVVGGCGSADPGVTLISAPYSQALTSADPEMIFEFCVTQLKFEAGAGQPVEFSDGEAERRLGLVSLGNGASEVIWGSLDYAAGTVIERIHVEIHHDAELCDGVAHSVAFGNDSLTQDIEMSFAFDEGQEIPESGVVVLDLAPVVVAYQGAVTAGKFTNQDIGSYIQGLEGHADAEEQ